MQIANVDTLLPEQATDYDSLLLIDRRQHLEKDLVHYEAKLALFRDNKQFANIGLAELYESRTSHIRRLIDALQPH
jgi:hypothetical protein